MRIPLASDLISRDGTVAKDAKVKNGIIEVAGDKSAVRKRYGTEEYAVVNANEEAQHLTLFAGQPVAIVGDVVGIDNEGEFASGATWTNLGTGTALRPNTYNAIYDYGTDTFYAMDVSATFPFNSWYMYKSTDKLNWTKLGVVYTTDDGKLRTGGDLCLHNGELYCFATRKNGFGGQPPDLAEVYKSTDLGLTWSKIASGPGYSARYRVRVISFGGFMYLAGGYNGYSGLADVWKSVDGINWSETTANFGVGTYQHSLITDGTSMIIVDAGKTYTSTNGVSWTALIPTNIPVTYIDWSYCFYYSGKIWASTIDASTPDLYYLSGSAWATANSELPFVGSGRQIFSNFTTMITPSTYAQAIGYSAVVDSSNGIFVTLTPTTAGLQYSSQDNGANAQSLLMLKNRQQAWTMDAAGNVTAINSTNYPGNYSVDITSLTRSGTVATAETPYDTNFQIGSTVLISGASPAGYNGSKVITGVNSSVSAIVDKIGITLSRSGTTVTAVTKSEPHGLVNGQEVTIEGATQTAYNGVFSIAYVSPTSFTYTCTVTPAGTEVLSPLSPATGSLVLQDIESWGFSVRKSTEVKTYSTGTNTTLRCTPQPYVGGFIASQTAAIGTIQVGESITVSGLRDPNTGTVYDGQYTVASLDLNSAAFNITLPSIPSSFYSKITVTRSITMPTVVSIVRQSGDSYLLTTSGSPFTYAGTGVTYDGFTISGADQIEYNGSHSWITVISPNSLSFQISTRTSTQATDEQPITPATGSISVSASLVSGASFTYTVASDLTTPATGTITASGGRLTVPGIAYMDGYFFVMDIYGVIYNSDLNAPTTWNSIDYITAESETGAGKCLAKSLNYIVAFKEWSTEFFYNAANAVGSPLGRVDNGFTLIGCASGESVAEVDGSLAWVSQIRGEGRGVYMMQGIQQAKVSTQDIERILNADDLATVFSYGIKLQGHALYVLTLITSNITLVFDVTSKVWSQWSSLEADTPISVSTITQASGIATVTTAVAHGLADGDPVTIAGAGQADYNGTFQIMLVDSTSFKIEVASTAVTPATGTITATTYTESYFKMTHYAYCNGDLNLALHKSNGSMYKFDESYTDDAGAPIDLLIRTGKVDDGSTNNKTIGKIEVIGNKAATSAMLRWSNDDYQTNSSYKPVNLNDDRSQLRRCGDFRRRSIELRHTDNVAVQLSELEI